MALRPADLLGKACATSRPASRSSGIDSSITWASASRVRRIELAGRCQRKARLFVCPDCGVGVQRLITSGEFTLYVDLKNWGSGPLTISRPRCYALDCDDHRALCLSRSFRGRTSAAGLGGGEDAQRLLDPARATFRVLSTSRMASCIDRSCVCGASSSSMPEAGAIARRGSSATAQDFARLYVTASKPWALLSSRVFKSNIDAQSKAGGLCRRPARARHRSTGVHLRSWTISLDGFYTRQDYIVELVCGMSYGLQGRPSPARRWSSSGNNFSLPAATICVQLYTKPLDAGAQGSKLQVDQAACFGSRQFYAGHVLKAERR